LGLRLVVILGQKDPTRPVFHPFFDVDNSNRWQRQSKDHQISSRSPDPSPDRGHCIIWGC